MADFKITYEKFIKPFEGGYVNIAADKGGETYAGIARNKFPNWQGWTYIDFEKRTKFAGKEIPRNHYFPDIQYLVDDFYLNRWNNYLLSEIKNQNIASLLFDYIIHSGAMKAVTAIQRIVKVTADGIIGPQTLKAINRSKPVETFSRLLSEREKFLKQLIAIDPTQKVFEKGWTARIETFKKLMPPTIAGGLIVAIALLTLITLS